MDGFVIRRVDDVIFKAVRRGVEIKKDIEGNYYNVINVMVTNNMKIWFLTEFHDNVIHHPCS